VTPGEARFECRWLGRRAGCSPVRRRASESENAIVKYRRCDEPRGNAARSIRNKPNASALMSSVMSSALCPSSRNALGGISGASVRRLRLAHVDAQAVAARPGTYEEDSACFECRFCHTMLTIRRGDKPFTERYPRVYAALKPAKRPLTSRSGASRLGNTN
jgi:hypothetical protein